MLDQFAGDASTLRAAVACLGSNINKSVHVELSGDIELNSGLDISTFSENQTFGLSGNGFEISAPSTGATSIFATTNGVGFLTDVIISGADIGISSTGTGVIEARRVVLKDNVTGASATSTVADGSTIWLRNSLVFDNLTGLLGDKATIRLNDSTVSENTVGANIRLGASFFIGNSTIAFNELHGLFINAQNTFGTPNAGQVYVFSSLIGLNGVGDFDGGEDCHLNVNSERIPIYFVGATANSFDSDGTCAPFAQQTINTSLNGIDVLDNGLSPDRLSFTDISPLADNGCEPEVDCFVRMTNAINGDSIARSSGSCVNEFFAFNVNSVTGIDARGVARGGACDSGSHAYNGCETTYTLPNNTWKQISLPCDPGLSNSVAAIFGDDLGTYGSDWILWDYDPDTGYRQPGLTDPLVQGKGYWIIQDNIDEENRVLDMPAGSARTEIVPLNTCIDIANVGCFLVPLETHSMDSDAFNMIGNPYDSEMDYFDIGVTVIESDTICDSVCALPGANDEEIIFDRLFVYNGSGYDELPTDGVKLAPWSGAWLGIYEGAQRFQPEIVLFPLRTP